MNFINSSGRFCNITIGGSDFSQELIHFECGEDEVSESGIVFCQGTVKLQERVGTVPFSLDDRVNEAFAKGSEVVISVEDVDFHRSVMWVREAHYDLKERIMVLQICDLLSLLSGKDFGDKSKVCVGHPKPIFEIINNLLTSVGAPPLIDQISGVIDYPIQGDNPISLAGQLAWSAGHVLYMNKRTVRGKLAKFISGGRIKGIDQILDYDRLSTGELPPAEIVITGEVKSIKSNTLNNRIYNRSWGKDFWSETVGSGTGDYRSVITNVYERGDKVMPWYFEGRIGGLILSQTKVEEYEYEPRAIANKDSGDDCNDNLERYLKRKITTTLQPFGVVLREWILLHDLDENKNITYLNLFGNKVTVFINYFALIISEKEVVDYQFAFNGGTYNINANAQSDFEILEDNGARENNLIVQKIVTKKSAPSGKIFAKPFKLSGRQIAYPEGLSDSEYHEESWRTIGGEYQHNKLEMTSFATHDSAAAEALHKQEEEGTLVVSTSSYLGLVVVRSDLNVSGSGSTQPPAPETAPPEFEISDSQKTFKAKVRSPYAVNQYSPPPQEYSIPWVLTGGEAAWKAQAENIGNILMGLAWGRYKGIEVTDELFGSYEPLTPFALQEPNGAYSYVSDGFAVSITRDQCLCRYSGLLAGENADSSFRSATSSGSGSTAGSIAFSVPLVRDINTGTTVFVGGTTTTVNTNLAEPLLPGGRQIAIASPTRSPIPAGTIVQVGNRQAVVSTEVPDGSTVIPIHPSALEAALNSSIQYRQITGGTPITVATRIPAGSTEIPLGVSVPPGTTLSWIEQEIQQPFQLVSPIEGNLILFSGARDRSPAPLGTQPVAGTLKIFGTPRNPEQVSSTLILTGSARRVTLPEYSLGTLRIFSKAIAYPNMAGSGSRIRDRNFTPQSTFQLELGLFLRVDWIRIVIWEPFDNGWLLSVGDVEDNQRFISTDYLNTSGSLPNILEINPGYQYATPSMVYLYHSGNSQIGAGTIYISQG